jgi:pyruvate ferredoxin oxidoreductase gamma subunit
MFQARIHGRGGQGAVTAADLMAIAAFHSGRHSLSFPSFGSERMGAPVTAFVRIDDREIELREPILNPDMLIVLDPTLFHAIDVFAGLEPDGIVLINSRKSVDALGLGDAAERLPAGHMVTIPATDLALKHLKLPKPNTVLVAGAAALRTDLFDEPALAKAIMQVFPGRVGESNVAAAHEAFELVKSGHASRVSSRCRCAGGSACCSK